MDLGLRGKVAVITGGSVGFGLAVAEGLAAEGRPLPLPLLRQVDPRHRLHLARRRRDAEDDLTPREEAP